MADDLIAPCSLLVRTPIDGSRTFRSGHQALPYDYTFYTVLIVFWKIHHCKFSL